MSSTEMKYMLVVTDPMEECDDESAIYYLRKLCDQRADLFIEVLCVGGHVEEEKRRQRVSEIMISEPSLETNNFKVGCLSDKPKYAGTFTYNFILQIGPIQDTQLAKNIIYTLSQYTYMLQGSLGTTNSNKQSDAYDSAVLLHENAERKIIFSTKVDGKLRCPQFSNKTSKLFPPEIRNEILRVGFRNTVGRAPPKLRFLNQLVGPGGANYEVVKGMWEYINPKSKFETLSTETDEKLQNAIKIYNPNFKEQEKFGLAKIQVAISIMFGMELTNIYTSTDQCFTLKNLLGKGGTLSEQFEKFQNLTEVYENIALTPCYDLAAAYCAFTYLFEQEKYAEIFEAVELDQVAVKEKYNNTSFVEFCF